MDDLFSFCLSCGAAGLIVCRHTSFDELLVINQSSNEISGRFAHLHIGKKIIFNESFFKILTYDIKISYKYGV